MMDITEICKNTLENWNAINLWNLKYWKSKNSYILPLLLLITSIAIYASFRSMYVANFANNIFDFILIPSIVLFLIFFILSIIWITNSKSKLKDSQNKFNNNLVQLKDETSDWNTENWINLISTKNPTYNNLSRINTLLIETFGKNNWFVVDMSNYNFSANKELFYKIKRKSLSGFVFKECIFDDLDMSSCDLQFANMFKSSFRNVNFSNSSLKNSNLSKCNFDKAHIVDADLRFANLSGAEIDNTLLAFALQSKQVAIDRKISERRHRELIQLSKSQHQKINSHLGMIKWLIFLS